MALPSSGIKKSCTRTASGSPCGRHVRPAFLKSPTNSFFLVSTEIAGCAAASAAPTLVDVIELGIAIRVVCSLTGLAVGLQTVAQPAQQPGNLRMADAVAQLVQGLGDLPQALDR